MKFLGFFILSILAFNAGYGQTTPFDTVRDRAEAQFRPDVEKPDYNVAINDLKKVLTMNSRDAETHYFLGYAYSRLNSSDASTIPKMKKPLVLKASAELEKVISLSPVYDGKIITLDPYSKLTSEWGSMALAYEINKKPDSAAWAFEQGKKRGGFDDFILAINRGILTSCSENSILITSGDNYTFPLHYLQYVEKFRPDVTVIDVSMINTEWYPKYIERTTSLKFGISEPALDTLDYVAWNDTTISIPVNQTGKTFSWVLKPTYQDHYLLRGDRLFLSLLKENQFKRDVFFTKGFVADEQLNLSENLLKYALVDKINAQKAEPQPNNEYIADMLKLTSTFKPVNPYSPDELTHIDDLRWDIMNKMEALKVNDSNNTLVRLHKILTDYLSVKDFPCYSDDVKKDLESFGINQL
ncbi:MAG TPA: hypothetical protein VGN20_04445 [Mucilaginibacter sp.]|jgi:hypothetical protein